MPASLSSSELLQSELYSYTNSCRPYLAPIVETLVNNLNVPPRCLIYYSITEIASSIFLVPSAFSKVTTSTLYSGGAIN